MFRASLPSHQKESGQQGNRGDQQKRLRQRQREKSQKKHCDEIEVQRTCQLLEKYRGSGQRRKQNLRNGVADLSVMKGLHVIVVPGVRHVVEDLLHPRRNHFDREGEPCAGERGQENPLPPVPFQNQKERPAAPEHRRGLLKQQRKNKHHRASRAVPFPVEQEKARQNRGEQDNRMKPVEQRKIQIRIVKWNIRRIASSPAGKRRIPSSRASRYHSGMVR